MTNRIGPSFQAELAAAGCPFSATCVTSYSEDGTLTFADGVGDAIKAKAQAVLAAHDPTKPGPVAVPDNPTLSDWRVALTLWGRKSDVTAKVAALASSTDPAKAMLGSIAQERLEYANHVLRSELLTLKDALGFTAADVDESLWRANQVSIGDLSGRWPLT